MKKQLIISVGREFGSGGHVIAEAIAKNFSIPLYDYNLLHEIAAHKNVDGNELIKYDEVPRNIFFHRNVNGHHNSPAVHIAEMQFDFLRKKAENGESFVVVGRCAEHVLKGNPNLISIFILGDPEAKVQRIMELHSITKEAAEQMIRYKDRKRKTYHNFYCSVKWGDSRNYDICINSSRLGIEETANELVDYINKRIDMM
ncbi:MAG: cytidylate kinase-like family protein [Clostridia bacterium]|nr:cytidylate kinase-like family protein [Clostridia bacterium]